MKEGKTAYENEITRSVRSKLEGVEMQ